MYFSNSAVCKHVELPEITPIQKYGWIYLFVLTKKNKKNNDIKNAIKSEEHLH